MNIDYIIHATDVRKTYRSNGSAVAASNAARWSR
jgi:hypothetical protein